MIAVVTRTNIDITMPSLHCSGQIFDHTRIPQPIQGRGYISCSYPGRHSPGEFALGWFPLPIQGKNFRNRFISIFAAVFLLLAAINEIQAQQVPTDPTKHSYFPSRRSTGDESRRERGR